MAVEQSEWSGDTKALAACLEALLLLVRDRADPATLEPRHSRDSESCNPASGKIAAGLQPE